MPKQYEEQIIELQNRFSRRGIALHRPYPPKHPILTLSKFGGCPNLPHSIDWPYCIDPHDDTLTAPLHFLMQINCCELPEEQTQLPKTGGLFFFARMDEESIWDDKQNAKGDVRVIYVEGFDKSTPPRRPPPDTFQIYSNKKPETEDFILPTKTYLSFDQKRLIVHPEEEQVFPEWPMEIVPFDSFAEADELRSELPTTLQGDDKYTFMDTYHSIRQDRVKLSVQANLAEAGLSADIEAPAVKSSEPQTKEDPAISKQKELMPWLHMPEQIADVLPQLAVFPLEIAAHLGQHIKKGIQTFERSSEPSDEVLGALKKNFEQVALWISRLKGFESTHLISRSEADEFLTWLSFMANQTYLIKHTRLFGADRGKINIIARPVLKIHKPYWEAVSQIVRKCAVSAELYAAMPDQFFEYPKRCTNTFSDIGTNEPHQMLSYFPSSQDSFDIHSSKIHLLYLHSDDALNFRFWDCGEATFFIPPEDLTDKNMGRAWASIQG